MLKWPTNIKRHSTSLVIREMQIQATMRHDYTSIRLLKLTSLTIHVLVKTGQLEFPHTAGGNSTWQNYFGKVFLIK